MPERYTVELAPRAHKQLTRLDSVARARVGAALTTLADNPRPPAARALTGMPGYLRVRVGDYRIVYMIEDGRLVVLVLVVAHRREAYRGLR